MQTLWWSRVIDDDKEKNDNESDQTDIAIFFDVDATTVGVVALSIIDVVVTGANLFAIHARVANYCCCKGCNKWCYYY